MGTCRPCTTRPEVHSSKTAVPMVWGSEEPRDAASSPVGGRESEGRESEGRESEVGSRRVGGRAQGVGSLLTTLTLYDKESDFGFRQFHI